MKRLLLLAPAALLAACSAHAPPRPPPVEPPPAVAAPPAPVAPSTDVLVARARALRAEGDVAGAQAHLESALSADPGSSEARLELADLLVADGQDLDRAANLLVPVKDPGDGRLALVLARYFDARGEDANAAEAYGAALTVRDDPEARLRRALALGRLGRHAEAIPELERLRADRPGDFFARGHLAEAYEGAGRRAEAEAELRGLAEAQPDRPAGWERLAAFYRRCGRERDAREAAGRAHAQAGARTDRALRPLLPSKN